MLFLAYVILNSSFIIYNCFGQWVQMSNGMGNDKVVNTLVASGNNIFAGLNNGLWLSTNNGQNWTQTSLNKDVRALAVSGSYIFAGTFGDYVFFSTNNGVNWTAVSSGMTDNRITAITINGANIFAGTYGSGIFRSTNKGTNWIAVNSGLTYKYIISLGANGVMICAGANQNLYRSINNGNNWNAVLGFFYNQAYCFAYIDETTYVGLYWMGVYRTTDNGENWWPIGLGGNWIYSLVTNGDNIFAGTAENGVYFTSNFGTNWVQINQGFNVISRIYELIIANNYIFAGTSGQSIWRRPLSEIIGIKTTSTEIPSAYSLEQNYPNPFNQSTMFNVQCSMAGMVKVSVYDISGKEVATLLNEKLQPGVYSVQFDAGNLPSGIYYYRLQTENYTDTKSMILLK